MKVNLKKLLVQAEKIYKSGDLEQSKKIYESILIEFPKNSKARKGLSKILQSANQVNTKNLSKDQINRVINLYSIGKFQEAIDAIATISKNYPNVPVLYNINGACFKSLGQLDIALQMFEKASNLKHDYAEAYYNQGVILKEINNLEESIERYKKAISFLPNYPDAHNNLGNAYKELGMRNDAIDSYEWALAYSPNNAVVHLNLGVLYSDFDQESALKHYKKAIKINPNYSEAYFNMGSILRHIGNKEESLANYEKAIETKPDYIEAHKNLSAMKHYKKNDPQIKQMQSFLVNNDLSLADRIALNFALSKVNEDLQNIDDFFKFLNEGNALRKKELSYSITRDQELFQTIKSVFGDKFTSKSKSISLDLPIRPIFILGMPRSGTSLVEQIISSHNEVFGAGELEFLAEFSVEELKKHFRSGKANFPYESFVSIRNHYLSAVGKLNSNKSIITDKMPLNFRFIGFILQAFPEAKIVHLNRDARATCWSIYKYYFKSTGHGFAHNFEDLSSYYSLYSNLMDFWRQIYPNKIYDISYEKLTSNQESETRKLLNYCDLDWDENCLNFHKNKRAVKTTSALQVRQKMYQGSSEAWKKYESFIKPLVDGLKSF